MARPKKTNYDDEIINIDMQIERYENSLRALQHTRKQMVEQRDKVELTMLHDTIKRSGRSVHDIIQALDEISQRKTAIAPTPTFHQTQSSSINEQITLDNDDVVVVEEK